MNRNIKESILKSAEYLFATKGFEKATVSDIAKAAKVHETSIYNNFDSKRNILFAIYGKYFQKAAQTLQEHFKGMREPGPKLRKAIWHYLDDMKNNPNHAKLLMVGQRETAEFYDSKYYRFIKEYISVPSGIIIDGQKEALFRRDLSFRLIRNMALGACVFTVFDSIVQERSYDPDEYSDLIYQLVVNAAREDLSSLQRNDMKNGKGRVQFRKAQITETATEIFSKKGFLGATISDIARSAQLADGTLYEYFDTKEDILLGISDTYLQGIVSDDIFFNHLRKQEKVLRKLIWRWIWLLWSKKDFARILTLELFRNLKFYSSSGYKYLKSYKEQMRKVVEDGQRESLFIGEVPFPLYFNMIIGTVDQYLISHFLLHRPLPEISELNNIVDSLVSAIRMRDDGPRPE